MPRTENPMPHQFHFLHNQRQPIHGQNYQLLADQGSGLFHSDSRNPLTILVFTFEMLVVFRIHKRIHPQISGRDSRILPLSP